MMKMFDIVNRGVTFGMSNLGQTIFDVGKNMIKPTSAATTPVKAFYDLETDYMEAYRLELLTHLEMVRIDLETYREMGEDEGDALAAQGVVPRKYVDILSKKVEHLGKGWHLAEHRTKKGRYIYTVYTTEFEPWMEQLASREEDKFYIFKHYIPYVVNGRWIYYMKTASVFTNNLNEGISQEEHDNC